MTATGWFRTLLLLALLALPAACGSGATKGPGSDSEAPGDPDDTDRFEFTLPVGDTGVQAFEVQLYESLRSDDCDRTQRLLDGDGADRPWQELSSQRDVLLFQAGIAMCQGDKAAARRWLSASTPAKMPVQPTTGDIVQGLDSSKNLCQLYQAIGSVLAQEPPDDFGCPGGEPPGWPEEGEYGRDDPRTAEDEGTIPPSPSPGTDGEPSEETPSTPTGEPPSAPPDEETPDEEPDEQPPREDDPPVAPPDDDGGQNGDQSPE